MEQQTNPVYIDKERAAKILKLDPRTISEMAQKGVLGFEWQWTSKPRRRVKMILEADVYAEKERRESGEPSPARGNGGVSHETALMRVAESERLAAKVNLIAAQIMEQRALPAPPAPAPAGPKYEDWQWLTLEEAAAALRLPKRVLKSFLLKGFFGRTIDHSDELYIRWSAVRAFTGEVPLAKPEEPEEWAGSLTKEAAHAGARAAAGAENWADYEDPDQH